MFYRFLLLALLSLSACALTKPRQTYHDINIQKYIEDPLTGEETQVLLKEGVKNWTYGDGIGHTLVKVSSVVLFPPLALFWISNTVSDLAGYEPYTLEDYFPETARKADSIYTGVTEIPGHVIAKASVAEFRDSESRMQALRTVLDAHEDPINLSDS